MSIKNTQDTYGSVAKTLHWLIGIGVIGMMAMGTVMEDIPNAADKFWVYSLHKATGITILALMLVRLVWKLMNMGIPTHNAAHKPWEQKLSHGIHWGFYALLIAMPLSAWMMTGPNASTISWYGFFPIPNIAAADKAMAETYGEIHGAIGTLIWIALGLHVGGALKHAIIDRDNTLKRMLPVLLFALVLPVSTARADEDEKIPVHWDIIREESALTFTANQEGTDFEGQFRAFDGMITFDPKTPEEGTARIIIDLNSVATGNDERDKSVKEKDWFDVATLPTASYIVDRMEKGNADGKFIAKGRLILRGIERPLDLPFDLLITTTDGLMTAHATGETKLNRLEFGIGEGQWADPKMVGPDVTVKIDLTATANIEQDQ